jgi:DNA-binding GntR family transcriptional regulator
MSTIEHRHPLVVSSVVGLAYDEIRARIVGGVFDAGSRLGQAELAEQLGISRTSVREALRRLTGDGLVEFEVNRGFFVADIGLDSVLERLEARLVLEPMVARLAAERRTSDDLDTMEETLTDERNARTAADAHDASRAFHRAVACATQNDAFVRIFDSLWIADVGRRLLARRFAAPTWKDEDISEHKRLLRALYKQDADRAETVMRAHVESAFRHWSDRRPGES